MGYIYVCLLHMCVCTVYIWEQKGTVRRRIIYCPGDLSVLTSSLSRLRCSRWRLPGPAVIDGEHGAHGGPVEFWAEPVGTNQPCSSDSTAPSCHFSLLWLFFIALLRFLAFFPPPSFRSFPHPCFSVTPSLRWTGLVSRPLPRRCFSSFGCHKTAGAPEKGQCEAECALHK